MAHTAYAQTRRSFGGKGMRSRALGVPLVVASLVLALFSSTDARALPDGNNALFARDQTVQVPDPSQFVVGSIIGQPTQTREYWFDVEEMNGAPDGVSKPMIVVNGTFPGPTIEANEGDTVKVHVTNHISNRTTIHWHGIFQNGTNYYDGVQGITECGIPPGQTLTYEFPLQEFTGTTWWHSLDTQYTDGEAGALIVHPKAYPAGFPTWDEDLVLQLADNYHELSAAIIPSYLNGGGRLAPIQLETPDSGLTNGVGQYNGSSDYYNLKLQPGKTYRLRVIHIGSSAQIKFSIDFHKLTVIETDSTLNEPYDVSSVTLAVAQRYSVLITTSENAEPDGNYWIRTEYLSLSPVAGTTTDVRAILRYGDSNADPTTDADPGVPGSDVGPLDLNKLVPFVPETLPAPTKSYTVDFDINNTTTGGLIANMNGTSWVPFTNTATLLNVFDAENAGKVYSPEGAAVESGDQFIVTADNIEVLDVLLLNQGLGDHPFHLHGHAPWILGFGSGSFTGEGLNTVNPINRDTFVVPQGGWLVFRIITDNPGAWTLHCHIQWHMMAGLLMQIVSLPSKMKDFALPQVIADQCKA
ncbi:multicopper oxidase [Phanerochaete sordida]|uniref:laccase n=1 Tax=Phanerochaete sordida TaxID=48140 RepID=A0A9P3GKV8_9APHY|nr:multicopper oxidase [Phanerochaete sordida]